MYSHSLLQSTAIEINNDVYENLKSYIQDNLQAREPRDWVHKRVTYADVHRFKPTLQMTIVLW